MDNIINEEKKEVIDKEEYIENMKKYAHENYVPILQDKSLEAINVLLDIKKPKKLLEIGTAIGYSASMFSYHLADGGKIFSVEINEETAKIAKTNIDALGLGNVIHVEVADGEEYMERLVKQGEAFDAIFIDAAKGQYMKYLNLALKLSVPGTLIIADNVLFKGMVLSDYNEHKHRTAVNRLREYIAEVKENPMLNSVVLDIGDGLAISVVKS